MKDNGEQATSRRDMLKGGAALAGAAYVAPAVLGTAVAAAQTTTCYNIKLQSVGCNDPVDISAGDSGCASFAPTGGPNGGAGAGFSQVSVLGGGCTSSPSATLQITCPPGTTIGSVRASTKGPGNPTAGCNPASVAITGPNTATLTFTTPTGQDVSHVSFGWCCTASS